MYYQRKKKINKHIIKKTQEQTFKNRKILKSWKPMYIVRLKSNFFNKFYCSPLNTFQSVAKYVYNKHGLWATYCNVQVKIFHLKHNLTYYEKYELVTNKTEIIKARSPYKKFYIKAVFPIIK